MLISRDKDAEALQVIYDPEKVTYRTLLEFFYKMHDPTTANRQGPDTGSQYRSAIFYHNAEQEKEAREITKQVNEKWWKGGVVLRSYLQDSGGMRSSITNCIWITTQADMSARVTF
jgi:methionine-S-sulfoxide reductase